jgi:tRNA A37 threonylcarbamoyladenosine dehydratase
MASFLPVIGQPVVAPATSPEAPEPAARTHRRFDRAARLVGEPGLHTLHRARVLVFGVGGVGSFAAESLARTGTGTLALVDFDEICVTNANRQLHALKGTIGKRKVEVMAERLRLVNPVAVIEPVAQFYSADTSEALLAGRVDFVVDAIDNLTAKAHLVATCLARGIPIVSSMGAAARLDPTRVRIADLADTEVDPFARALRKLLREKHGIEARKGLTTGVTAVFSDETPIAPDALSYDAAAGFVCVCPNGSNGLHSCEKRSRIEGSASFVTGAFGLACASVVVRRLTGR